MKINGKKIFLRSLNIDDVYGRWWQWFNDPEVTRFMNKGNSENNIKKQLNFFNKTNNSKKFSIFAICEKKLGIHIGTTGLHHIDLANRSAQFGIVIGEKNYWSKGLGSEGWSMMVEYGFNVLKLKSINTKIFSQNISSIKIAEKIGFNIQQVIKEDIFKNNIPYDRTYMDITYEKWLNK